MTADILPLKNKCQHNVGFLQVRFCVSYNPNMVDPAATPPHRTDAIPASRTDPRERLASLDDALLILLAKRLAHALLNETVDTIDRERSEISSRPLDSASPDSHSS